MAQYVECPRCTATNAVPDEYIGRYFRCPECRCRYYVPVPTPDDTSDAIVERPPPAEPATLDDLLRDSQEGQGAILRALSEQQRTTAKLLRALDRTRWLLIVFVVLAVAELAILLGWLADR